MRRKAKLMATASSWLNFGSRSLDLTASALA